MKPRVYFSRLKKGKSRSDCLKSLLAGLGDEISQFKKDSFVGVKMTVGDEKSTGYIKPDMVRMLVQALRAQGAKPFVFDTNVIYKGKRQNAVDHLNLAYSKQFTPDNLGCPYIIADGIFGSDSKTLRADLKTVREIRVPSLVGVLEELIVLTHVTGHIMSGFAGSVKNVAMGMASRAGKQVQHSSVKPSINTAKCTVCGCCLDICPAEAISEASGKVFINSRTCIGCGECIASCKFDAITVNWKEEADVFVSRMADYAHGILSRIRNKLFINVAFDVTEECDCISTDDQAMVADTGIFASGDILAVDRACYDILAGGKDVFSRGGKISAHVHQFKYAQEIGLGSLRYELVQL